VSAVALARPGFPRALAFPGAIPAMSWLPTLRKAVRALATAAGLLVAALFVLLTVLPRAGSYATFTVLSGSMEPLIPKGSVVFVTPVPADQIHLGDVISFTSTQPPFPTLSHRVIGIQPTDDGSRVFKTKGDANLLEDPWEVRYAGRAGKVRLTLPIAGYAIAASTSALGRVATGLGLFAFLGWFWVRRLWRVHARVVAPVRSTQASASVRQRRGQVSSVRVAMFCWLLLRLALSLLFGRRV